MSTTHQILRLIACHGSVNAGNFGDDVAADLNLLVESGDIKTHVDDDESLWCRLTSSGHERLHDLNFADIGEFTAHD